MNLLVYNFFDETPEAINQFLEVSNSSVYFAISISDIIRILTKNRIDVAIVKFVNFEQDLVEKIVSINFRTKFYISSTGLKPHSFKNIYQFPPNVNLKSISEKISYLQ